MNGIKRTIEILLAFWKLNWLEELQYRGNFIASLLGTIFWLVVAMLTVSIYFRHTPQLGGWSYWEVVVLLGVFNALTGVVETVLRPGIGHLPADVRSGALDLVLTRPVDAQFYVSFRRLDVWRLADVVLGFGLSGYALAQMGRGVGAWQLIAFAVTFSVAIAVVYAIWVALMSFAFWFVAVENMATLFDAVTDAARYPVSAYPGVLRFVFVYLITIGWAPTIPAAARAGRVKHSPATWSGGGGRRRRPGATTSPAPQMSSSRFRPRSPDRSAYSAARWL